MSGEFFYHNSKRTIFICPFSSTKSVTLLSLNFSVPQYFSLSFYVQASHFLLSLPGGNISPELTLFFSYPSPFTLSLYLIVLSTLWNMSYPDSPPFIARRILKVLFNTFDLNWGIKIQVLLRASLFIFYLFYSSLIQFIPTWQSYIHLKLNSLSTTF